MSPTNILVAIKLVHTLVWAVMASAILTMPWFIVKGRRRWGLALMALVAAECVVLALNQMRCPLTDLAARYTSNRTDNFDIYLPLWLARYNKTIFGTLFAMEVLWVGWRKWKPLTLLAAAPSDLPTTRVAPESK